MAPGRSRWLLLGLLQSVAWVPCLWGNQRWRRPSGFHATGDLEYFEVYSKDWRMTEAYGVVVVCVVMGIGADSPRVCRSWYRPIRIWHNLTAIENAKAWWITNHLKTTILDKLYTKRASISDMFGTGPTEFGRISSFSSCKNDLHKKDLLGSRRRLNDSWSHAVAETAAAVSAVPQLNCRFQPPSTISIGPLFSPKWLDNSKRKSNKSTTRPPSFLYLISSTRNGELLGRGESYATTSGVCVPGGSLAIGLLWGQSWSQGAHRNPRISWKWEDAEFLLPSLVLFREMRNSRFLSCWESKIVFSWWAQGGNAPEDHALVNLSPQKFVQKAAWT